MSTRHRARSLGGTRFVVSGVKRRFRNIVDSIAGFNVFIRLPGAIRNLIRVSGVTRSCFGCVRDRVLLVNRHAKIVCHVNRGIGVGMRGSSPIAHTVSFSLIVSGSGARDRDSRSLIGRVHSGVPGNGGQGPNRSSHSDKPHGGATGKGRPFCSHANGGAGKGGSENGGGWTGRVGISGCTGEQEGDFDTRRGDRS